MEKHFFKAPFRKSVYTSLKMESKKFAAMEDGRIIIAAEPPTLREYYVVFISEVPFQACVEDRAELALPYDLERADDIAEEVRRGRGRISLRWAREDEFSAKKEVEIRSRLSQRGIAEVPVRGHGEVRNPHICRDPDNCMRPASALTLLYELAHEYKVLDYRGAAAVDVAARLLSKKNFSFIEIHNADADEAEQLLKKAGFEVVRRCGESKARLRIEKISETLHRMLKPFCSYLAPLLFSNEAPTQRSLCISSTCLRFTSIKSSVAYLLPSLAWRWMNAPRRLLHTKTAPSTFAQ